MNLDYARVDELLRGVQELAKRLGYTVVRAETNDERELLYPTVDIHLAQVRDREQDGR